MLTEQEITKIKKSIASVDDERVRLVFDALGDPNRFQILKLLIQSHDVCVTDVANVLGVTVPAASQQFRILELSGIVKKNRMGQSVCYEIRDDNPLVSSIMKILNR